MPSIRTADIVVALAVSLTAGGAAHGQRIKTDYRGSDTKGFKFHKPDYAYRAGDTHVRFYAIKRAVGPSKNSPLPDRSELKQITVRMKGPSHYANTDYFYALLKPGEVLILKQSNVEANEYGARFVFRDKKGDWHVASNADGWEPLPKGKQGGSYWIYPERDVHIDLYRPKTNAASGDREIDFRFRLDPNRRTFPTVTVIEQSGAARKAGLKVGDAIISYSGKCCCDDRDKLKNFVADAVKGKRACLVYVRDGRTKSLYLPSGEDLGIEYAMKRPG